MGKVVTFGTGGTMPTAAQYDAIQDAGWWRKADGAGVDAWAGRPGDGSLHRFGVVPKINAGENITLDTSIDWRDRLLLVEYAVGAPFTLSPYTSGFDLGFSVTLGSDDAPAWPGLNEEISFTDNVKGAQMLWTERGVLVLIIPTSKPSLAIELQSNLWLHASFSFGELRLTAGNNLATRSVGVLLNIHAHDQLGIFLSPTSLSDPSPSDTESITPGELNVLQDAALSDQFNAWDQAAITSPTELRSMPLGPKVDGENPGVPQAWVVRRRDGLVSGETTWQRRQRMAGGERRRVCSFTVADGASAVLDSTLDWRDRFIQATGRWHTAELRPGDATDVDYNARTAFAGTFYSFEGKAIGSAQDNDRHQISIGALSFAVMVDETTGNLVVRNDTGGTRYGAMIVDATPQLGPRAERLE